MLGHDERPVVVHLGDREAGMLEPRHLLEERVVAAGGLRAALQDVARDHRRSEPVPVRPAPAEVPRRRPDHDRRVRDARGNDDVGAAVERLDDAPGAEVSVGRDRVDARRGERLPAVQVGQFLAARLQLRELRQDVVAFDVRDVRLQSETVGEGAHPHGERRRV